MTVGFSYYLEDLEVSEMELLKNMSLPGSNKYAFQASFISEFRGKFYNVQEQCQKGVELSKAEREFAIYAAPGSGKTKMGSECMVTSNTGLWLAHTDDLMNQAYDQLQATCKDHGIPETAVKKLTFKDQKALEDWIEKQQNLPEADRDKYVVVSIPSVGKKPQEDRLQKLVDFLKPDCTIIDEAHHAEGERGLTTASTKVAEPQPENSEATKAQNLEVKQEVTKEQRMMDRIANVLLKKDNSTILHLTATPVKTLDKDGQPVELDHAQVVGSMGLEQAIKLGLLTEIEVRKTFNIPMSAADRNLTSKELADIYLDYYLKPSSSEAAVLKSMNTHLGLPEKHRAVIFCATVKEAEATAKEISKGFSDKKPDDTISVAVISGSQNYIKQGDTKIVKARSEILEMYRKGEIDAICNCGVATEGVDLPQTTLLMLNRPANSVVLGTQIIGRLLRTLTGKDRGFLFDHRYILGVNRTVVGLKSKIPKLSFPATPAFYKGGINLAPVKPTRVSTPPPVPVSSKDSLYANGFDSYLDMLQYKGVSGITLREFVDRFYDTFAVDKKEVMTCDKSRFVATLIARHKKIDSLPLSERSKHYEKLYGKGEVVAVRMGFTCPRGGFVKKSTKKDDMKLLKRKANDVAAETNGYAQPWEPTVLV